VEGGNGGPLERDQGGRLVRGPRHVDLVLTFPGIPGEERFAEIAPATGFARNVASLEAMVSQIYLAVVISRLVGIQSAQPPAGRQGTAEETGVRPIEPG
jgi:hypothetical protein